MEVLQRHCLLLNLPSGKKIPKSAYNPAQTYKYQTHGLIVVDLRKITVTLQHPAVNRFLLAQSVLCFWWGRDKQLEDHTHSCCNRACSQRLLLAERSGSEWAGFRWIVFYCLVILVVVVTMWGGNVCWCMCGQNSESNAHVILWLTPHLDVWISDRNLLNCKNILQSSKFILHLLSSNSPVPQGRIIRTATWVKGQDSRAWRGRQRSGQDY